MYRRALVATAFLAMLGLVPSSASAYRVFLKDGTSLSAQAKYEIQGDRALITLESGAQTVIDFSEIDVVRTDEYNETHRYATGGVIIDGKPASAPGQTTDEERTLQDLIRARQAAAPVESSDLPPPRVQLRKTPAGYEDLGSLTRQPVASQELQRDLTAILRGEGLALFSLYEGSREGRLFIEVVTEGEGNVFDALEQACAALMILLEKHPDTTALEVLMKTSTRSRAGQFVLTSANAPLLVNGRMTVADFFVEHVEF